MNCMKDVGIEPIDATIHNMSADLQSAVWNILQIDKKSFQFLGSSVNHALHVDYKASPKILSDQDLNENLIDLQ